MKPIIIGVDPGITSAVAMLDFEGNLVALSSGKNFPPREIISEIVEEGKPVIVASDKAQIPSKVEKIANSVGAEKFELDEDLDRETKKQLGEGDNSHEGDAVASARYAFKQLRPKIDKIEQIAEEKQMDLAEVASKYFSDRPIEKESEGHEESNSEENIHKKKAQRLEEKVEQLQEKNNDLKEKLEFREEQRRNIQSKYDKLKDGKRQELLEKEEIAKKQRKIQDKQEKIEDLKDELERTRIREKQYEKALRAVEEGGKILPIIGEDVEEVPEVSVTRSEDLKNDLVVQGHKVFYIEDLEGVELLERFILEGDLDQNLKDVIQDYKNAR